jgi:hypothetical protein
VDSHRGGERRVLRLQHHQAVLQVDDNPIRERHRLAAHADMGGSLSDRGAMPPCPCEVFFCQCLRIRTVTILYFGPAQTYTL